MIIEIRKYKSNGHLRVVHLETSHIRGLYHIETSPLICSAKLRQS